MATSEEEGVNTEGMATPARQQTGKVQKRSPPAAAPSASTPPVKKMRSGKEPSFAQKWESTYGEKLALMREQQKAEQEVAAERLDLERKRFEFERQNERLKTKSQLVASLCSQGKTPMEIKEFLAILELG